MSNTALHFSYANSLNYIRQAENEIKLKSATKSEMQTVADIISSTADWYEPIVHEDDLSEHNPDAKWIERNWSLRDFFICRDGAKKVGALSMQKIAGMSYLGYVYVHKDAVGKGYGKKILQFAETRSKNLGHAGMFLIAHPKAEWAIRAYEKFGFKKVFDNDKEILSWNKGCMEPYHEKGFHLFVKKHMKK